MRRIPLVLALGGLAVGGSGSGDTTTTWSRVTDAEAPVAGAKARAGRKTATASGSATPPSHCAAVDTPVTATKAGYSPASARVRVR